MTRILEGSARGEGRKIAVAVAGFNADVTDSLLEGCLQALARNGVQPDDTTVARVPGAFELPAVCDRLAATGRFDALVALGAVIRGETPHFDYVAGACARGVMRVQLDRGIPVAFGVLTTDTLEQARARSDREVLAGGFAGPTEGAERSEKVTPRSNKGAEAAEVALLMASLLSQIQ